MSTFDADGYAQFLAAKAPIAKPVGFEPAPFLGPLFDFQRIAVERAIRRGRCALFLDTGLGKTICELEWARQCAANGNGHALLLTPLAVARQIEREAQRFGYNARVIREQSDVEPGISICNYDRLDKIDASAFGALVIDESSILKSFTGVTTRALIDMFSQTPYRLAATATPAPNDHMELGQHAEFLGVMPSNEMLMRWFTADQTQMGRYRIKAHGVKAFWDWCASWAVMAESPEDLGCDGAAFVLPPMCVHRHRAIGDVRAPAGTLFMEDLSATNMHLVKRQTAEARADAAAKLIEAEPDESWLLWVDTNYERDALQVRLPAIVDVSGDDAVEVKEDRLLGFADGRIQWLSTKPKIGAQGLNFQHCARVIFVGRTFSYEQWYQAVRRCWRFGQKRSVDVHLIVAEGEEQIGRTIDRKAEDHGAMKKEMRAASRRALEIEAQDRKFYNPTHIGKLPTWIYAH